MDSEPDATARQLTEQQIKTIKQLFKAIQQLEQPKVQFMKFRNQFRVTIQSSRSLPLNIPSTAVLLSDDQSCEVFIKPIPKIGQTRLNFSPMAGDLFDNDFQNIQLWVPAPTGVFFISVRTKDFKQRNHILLSQLEMMIFGNAPQFTRENSAVIHLFKEFDHPHASQYSVGGPKYPMGYIGEIPQRPFYLIINLFGHKSRRQVELRCVTTPRLPQKIIPVIPSMKMICAFGDARLQIDFISDSERPDSVPHAKIEDAVLRLLTQYPLPVSNEVIQLNPNTNSQKWRLYLRGSEIPELQITLNIKLHQQDQFATNKLFIRADPNKNWILGYDPNKSSGLTGCVIQ